MVEKSMMFTETVKHIKLYFVKKRLFLLTALRERHIINT